MFSFVTIPTEVPDRLPDGVALAQRLDREADAHLFEGRAALAEHLSRRASDLREEVSR